MRRVDDPATRSQATSPASAPAERSGGPGPQDEERRLAYLRTFGIGFWVYLAFFALDAYVVYLIGAEAPLGWFALVRIVAGTFIGAGWWLTRRTVLSERRAYLLLLVLMIDVSASIAVMAFRYGGLNSRYVQGISVVVMFFAALAPDRWQRMLPANLVTAFTFPAVLLIGAPFNPRVAAQWGSSGAVALFVHDFTFVVAIALIAGLASHFVWAARRQVYEQRKLGRYRLKLRIGAGGSGEVWLAKDEKENRDVALKILHAEAARKAGARARFEREARAAAKLHDPHTIRVFDFGASDDGLCYIAMELLDGADLGTLVRRGGPLPSARATRFIRQACDSLAEAHEKGILHRDVKPENLFALRDDSLKLLDFGLAKVARPEEDVTLTQQGFMGGTPAYMAPEACAGLSDDARSDLYSLGAVLYFLVTGAPPFTGASANAIMMAHAHQTPRSPAEKASVPADLERVILRCLAKSPGDRFPTARALAAALDACSSS